MKPYDEEYEYLWRVYPKRLDRTGSKWIKRKKYPGWIAWQKLNKETKHEIILKAKYIREFEGSHACDLVTWINNRGWDDIEFKKDFIPIYPEELTKKIGHAEEIKEILKEVDTNMQRTIQLRKLGVK